MKSKHWKTIPDFFTQAQGLRQFFEDQFEKPQEAHAQRFVWDYWLVPDQYRLVRTPAYNYFPEELYRTFEDQLIEWGQKNLGCHSISPPWLSYYVDGCYQNIHADNPHGPWAFVYSLTPEDFDFKGGETNIMVPEILDYWATTDFKDGVESDQIYNKIFPNFNQLTIFDPRLPHGVEKIHGTEDPRKARLVIHGWFTEPSPYFTENINEDLAVEALNSTLNPALDSAEELGQFIGILTYKLNKQTLQDPQLLQPLTNSLICLSEAYPENKQAKIEQATTLISKSLKTLPLDIFASGGEITLPLVFE